ncbi:peptidase domain-containing ABC transporter [Saprospira sp. CCB-QB6]|nr:peptidase domain-containing ABC transporter [Saprospira sp. CCB-QB6]WCL83067.1 peptidase domain-containing ABC transporter [Saprospira sp. CCB-QB6]
MEALSVKLSLETLIAEKLTPVILHWNQNHFVVLYKIKRSYSGKYIFKVADPRYGLISLQQEVFEENWKKGADKGIALILNPTDKFFSQSLEVVEQKKASVWGLARYVSPYKKDIAQLFVGLIGGSLITLTLPFMTQLLVDRGVAFKSLNIIYLILIGQFFLFLGASFIEIIKNWILLYIGSRTNIYILSNFLSKLMRLPLKFFDSKRIGDFIQRMEDHNRIEHFLTSQSLLTLFSIINLLVFSLILAYYNLSIIAIYFGFTTLAILWMFLFHAKRRLLDFTNFAYRAENQDSIYELLHGMQEIKLNNLQDYKREQWENIQIKLFNNNISILATDQYQLTGYQFINQFKNILVTFIAAQQVVLGNISLGAMLSIIYIVGQMNSPIEQLITFFRSLQDTQLSLERLEEIHRKPDEEQDNQVHEIPQTPHKEGIQITELTFRYEGPQSPAVLHQLSCFIPQNQTTAIVGASGSGKTSLIKLLLKFQEAPDNSILVNGLDLNKLSPQKWRGNCGAVMQEGFIFSDTIARNIATNDIQFDPDRLSHAIKMANLEGYIQKQPLGINTSIGQNGNGLSGGEKQRILIARAIYKDPQYLFFDEATSALDAANEKIIMTNLNHFFTNKTVVVVAHRLSTVKNAHQIIVLDQGEIVEVGNHTELTAKKGTYFHLIKNQLELGN